MQIINVVKFYSHKISKQYYVIFKTSIIKDRFDLCIKTN